VNGGENTGERGFIVLASFALVAAICYFAKEVFIPIALALLFTFLLAPVVTRMQRWKFPKAIAITLAVTLTFSVAAFVTWLVTTQFIALAGQLPKYEQNLQKKIHELNGSQGSRPFDRATGILKGLQKDFEESTVGAEQPKFEPGSPENPLTVEMKPPRPTFLQNLRRTLGPALEPAGTIGIVTLLVLTILFRREDLRDRFIKVVSGGKLNVATEAVDDAANRISRYLFMQLVVNVTYGIPIGIGLFFIGVPNALLWGVLATLLRFIPFLGPWIAALFPVALAFAIDPGWSKLLLTLSLFIVIELISNNLVEPWLYGSSTGVSPVAIVAGALFWTWLWGPIGLFLCTPLTVCVVVMGKYVPGLRFISDMFGSEPVLQPHARLYQRMLAMDAEEMLQIAEEHVEQHDLVTFYDQLMIPALILAEEDRQTGRLAEVRQQFIVQNSRELIEDLGEREMAKQEPRARSSDEFEVLCLPAKDDADEIAALMLVQVLRVKGISAKVISATTPIEQCEQLVNCGNIRGVIISALPPDAFGPARRLCRKLKRSCPSLKVTVGIWTPHAAATDLTKRLTSAQPEAVVTTLRSVLEQFTGDLDKPAATASVVRPGRSKASLEVGKLKKSSPEEIFNAVKRDVARMFDVPLAFVSIVQIDDAFWAAHSALTHDAEETNGLLRDSAVCAHLGEAEPVLVEDVSKDKRFISDTFLKTRGIQSYAAAPLRTVSGHAVGSLCVLDTKPRAFRPNEARELKSIAQTLMELIESRSLQTA
jgi:predicted PurR-regulated permease PerM